MSAILFVRHAQASLFGSDYDQLSERGRKQASLLGQHFAKQAVVFDEVYTGPRRRHQQTAAIVAENAGDGSRALQEIPELEEHQIDQLATRHVRKLAEQFPQLSELRAAFQAANGLEERQKSFARLFEATAELWVSGRCPLYDVESWPDFRRRVDQGINRIIDRGGRGRKVLAFTSAGTIAAILRRALGCSDDTALGLGWRLWNCSLTGIVFSTNRFSLDHFNALPHLTNRDDWTYR